MVQSHEQDCRFTVLRELLRLLSPYVRQFRANCTDMAVIIKSDHSPVTEIDYLVQLMFETVIGRLFPKDRVLGEETISDELAVTIRQRHSVIADKIDQISLQWPQEANTSALWIIDPIDGTKGFIDNRVYATGVVVVMDGKPCLSGIAVNGMASVFETLLDEPIIAMAFNGRVQTHYVNGDKVLIQTPASNVVLGSRAIHSKKFEALFAHEPSYQLVAMDSMAKYVAISLGLGNAYIRIPIINPGLIWDYLPGLFLLKQQQGICVDFDGASIRFSIDQGTVDLQNGLICCLSVDESLKFIKIVQESRRLQQ